MDGTGRTRLPHQSPVLRRIDDRRRAFRIAAHFRSFTGPSRSTRGCSFSRILSTFASISVSRVFSGLSCRGILSVNPLRQAGRRPSLVTSPTRSVCPAAPQKTATAEIRITGKKDGGYDPVSWIVKRTTAVCTQPEVNTGLALYSAWKMSCRFPVCPF